MWKSSSTLLQNSLGGGGGGVEVVLPLSSAVCMELGIGTVIYGSQNFCWCFSRNSWFCWGAGGVRGPEWAEAGVGAIFHSDKINSSLKGGKSRQSWFCSEAYLGAS